MGRTILGMRRMEAGGKPKMRPLNLEGPGEREVQIQLQRILESDLFSGSIIQSTILFFIVKATLEDEDIKAQHVHDFIYRKTKVGETSAKSNINLVRSKLKTYYKTIGAEDRILILLPPGRGYEPSFKYNVKTETAKIARLLSSNQQEFTFSSLQAAEGCYWWMENYDRLNPDMYLAMAQTKLLTAMLHGLLGVRASDASDAYRQVEEFAEKAFRCGAKGPWPNRLRILAEIMRVGRNKVDPTPPIGMRSENFEPDIDEPDLWSAFDLAATGLVNRANELFEVYLDEKPDDFSRNLAAAYFFYGTRRFDKANACLLSLRQGQKPLTDAYHLIQGLVHLEMGYLQDAWREFESIERAGYGIDGDHAGSRKEQKIMRIPGFAALALARWRGVNEGRDFLAIVIRDQRRRVPLRLQAKVRETYGKLPPLRPRNFQMAIAYTAFGQIGRALAYMRRAYWERDALVHFVPFMPFLDPLRKHPRWKSVFGNEDIDDIYRRYGHFLP